MVQRLLQTSGQKCFMLFSICLLIIPLHNRYNFQVLGMFLYDTKLFVVNVFMTAMGVQSCIK